MLHPSRLQHPEGVHHPPHPPPPQWHQETQEEDLHQAQEDQAQEEEGQACRPPVLQGQCLGRSSHVSTCFPNFFPINFPNFFPN